MTQHTPGPWETLDGAEITPKTGPNAFVTLAHIVGPWCNSEWYTDQYEARANGRLIAAAPEMLRFLREYADETETSKSLRKMEEARALLAKVEGKG